VVLSARRSASSFLDRSDIVYLSNRIRKKGFAILLYTQSKGGMYYGEDVLYIF
jgi:hypothetical protein